MTCLLWLVMVVMAQTMCSLLWVRGIHLGTRASSHLARSTLISSNSNSSNRVVVTTTITIITVMAVLEGWEVMGKFTMRSALSVAGGNTWITKQFHTYKKWRNFTLLAALLSLRQKASQHHSPPRKSHSNKHKHKEKVFHSSALTAATTMTMTITTTTTTIAAATNASAAILMGATTATITEPLLMGSATPSSQATLKTPLTLSA